MKRKLRRLGSLILALCMVITMLPGAVWGAVDEEFTLGGLKYKVLSEGSGGEYGTVSLVGYDGSEPTGKLTVAEAVYKDGISYNITEIGDNAFNNCDGLESVIIDNNVKAIGEDAFLYCSSLTKYIVDKDNPNFSAEDGALLSKDKKTLILYPAGKTDDSYTIPNSVKIIGDGAFRGNENLKTINTTNVVTIEKNSFSGSAIESIDIGDSAVNIGEYAFYGCRDLKTVSIPENSSLETIGNGVFGYCEELKTINLPASLKTIGGWAFGYCHSIESLWIGPLARSIGENAFYTKKLADFTVDPANKYYSSEDNVLYNKDKTVLIRYMLGKPDTSFTIPDTVTGVEESAFYATNKLESVIVPPSVNNIGESAFYWCGMKSISFFGDTPPAVGSNIFTSCANLTDIYVPVGSEDAYKTALAGVIDPATMRISPIDESISIYGLYIGDIAVNYNNKNSITGSGISGGISYKPNTRTLTLNNATIDPSSDYLYTAIKSSEDIAIKLIGNNRIGKKPNNPGNDDDYNITYGIFGTYVDGKGNQNITITGDGNLEIYDGASGIVAENITINISGKIKIVEYGLSGMACCLKASDILTINKADLDLYSYNTNNLFGYSIVINGGTIEAKTDGAYAFITKPSFDANYKFKVYAGNDKSTATAISNINQDIYTTNKYVRIEPLSSSDNNSGGSDKDKDKDKDKGSGSSSGSSGSTTAPTTAPVTTPTAPAPAVTTVNTIVSTEGKATAQITQEQINQVIAKAQEEAKKADEKPTIEIKLEGAKGANEVEASIPLTSIKEIASRNIDNMTITSDIGTISFDGASLKTISDAAKEDITINIAKADAKTLSDEAKAKVGDRPVYDFTIKSGEKTISQFNGAVTIALPYTPAPGEDTNAIVVYFINDKGELETITNGKYDPKTKTVKFETDHFSYYAIGYNKINYKDVKDTDWYKDAVSFISAREITTGTSEGSFNPDGILTRGQFITLLMRAYDIKPHEKIKDNFIDAGDTYYTPYLGKAKEMGLTKGIGDDKFAPDMAITRQDMSQLLYNTLKAIKKLPNAAGKSISGFTDNKDVSDYATQAMEYMVKAGILSGSDNKLSPKAITTRSQMAQVLYNLMK